jgi:hypothetical protein
MSNVTWGDTVRIKNGAPPSVRPGALAEIVGMREIETLSQAQQFAATIGSKVHLVEFGDGQALEIPEAWIEAAG